MLGQYWFWEIILIVGGHIKERKKGKKLSVGHIFYDNCHAFITFLEQETILQGTQCHKIEEHQGKFPKSVDVCTLKDMGNQ